MPALISVAIRSPGDVTVALVGMAMSTAYELHGEMEGSLGDRHLAHFSATSPVWAIGSTGKIVRPWEEKKTL